MRVSLVVAVVALFALAQPASAQGSQSPIGGGCEGLPTPTVVGPLTIGSTMAIEDVGCNYISSPGSMYILGFGLPLPQQLWVPIPLPQPPFNDILFCDLSIVPLIPIEGTSEPIRIVIPNRPELIGRKFALQTFCSTCGFAGCNLALSQALELTIG